MEQTTLQQRIEERAKQQLLNDLLYAANKEEDILQLFGRDNFKPQINARWHYSSYDQSKSIRLYDEFTQELFNKLLPRYITKVTDEILQKIDEIDYLVKGQQTPAEY